MTHRPRAHRPQPPPPHRVRRIRRVGLLTDAFALPSFALQILKSLVSRAEVESDEGRIPCQPMPGAEEALTPKADASVSWLSAEQSKSSLIVDDQGILHNLRQGQPVLRSECMPGWQ